MNNEDALNAIGLNFSIVSIPDDILMSALEGMLPPDLLRHIQLNRTRISTYEELRTEITLIAEDREGVPGGATDVSGYTEAKAEDEAVIPWTWAS